AQPGCERRLRHRPRGRHPERRELPDQQRGRRRLPGHHEEPVRRPQRWPGGQLHAAGGRGVPGPAAGDGPEHAAQPQRDLQLPELLGRPREQRLQRREPGGADRPQRPRPEGDQRRADAGRHQPEEREPRLAGRRTTQQPRRDVLRRSQLPAARPEAPRPPPLGQQMVDPADSAFGGLSNFPGPGLDTSYAALIQAAFRPEWWNSSAIVNGFSVMENNFSLYWGLSVMLYNSTQVSDDTRFDRFMDGNL